MRRGCLRSCRCSPLRSQTLGFAFLCPLAANRRRRGETSRPCRTAAGAGKTRELGQAPPRSPRGWPVWAAIASRSTPLILVGQSGRSGRRAHRPVPPKRGQPPILRCQHVQCDRLPRPLRLFRHFRGCRASSVSWPPRDARAIRDSPVALAVRNHRVPPCDLGRTPRYSPAGTTARDTAAGRSTLARASPRHAHVVQPRRAMPAFISSTDGSFRSMKATPRCAPASIQRGRRPGCRRAVGRRTSQRAKHGRPRQCRLRER